MLYYFQIYFIFLICEIVYVNCGNPQGHAAGDAATSSDIAFTGKCKAKYCKCKEIPKWKGVRCKDDDYFSGYPQLHFSSFNYLPARMFRGLGVYSVTLRDPSVTVAENFLDGILRLDRFIVEQSNIKVVPDFRVVKDSIRDIRMDSSQLTSLEGKHLQNLTLVWTLTFKNNSIRYIHPDVFWGTDNVEDLVLSHNKLTSIPPKLLDLMKKLKEFSADHNHLFYVDNLFSVTRPWKVYLGFNNITNFCWTQNAEKSRWELDVWVLDLSYNFIKDTPSSHSTCNPDIILEIRHLKLNGNKLLNLYDCLRCSKIEILEMMGNQIQLLTERDFLSVYGTQELLLRENRIRRIDTDTFQPLNASLVKLDLSYNNITSINGSVRYLSNLWVLDLSHNSIQTLAEDEFIGLYSHIYSSIKLYLQHNQIKSLGMTLQKIGNLEVLNIAHNDIKFIMPKQVPNTLESIYLEGNLFKCDWNLKPFLSLLRPSTEEDHFEVSTAGFVSFDVESIRIKQRNCPPMCSCRCSEYGDVFYRFVDCSSRNLRSIPRFLSDNLTWFEESVVGLSLENNSLEFLDASQLPVNLVALYLSDNKLRRFPETIIDHQQNLKQVSLSRNQWNCDCNALKFKNWLSSNYDSIKDFDNVRCGISDEGGRDFNGSVLWKLEDLDLCPVTDFVMIFSVSALSFIIMCLVARKIYRKYELSIKVSLYSHGFHFVKEKVLEHDKAFDVFISFSHKDDEFVIEDLISEIETRDPNIRLCLHYRHFRPGEQIIDNIAYAVQRSKMTVLILSRNFLESEWCLLEFQTAHKQTFLDKVHRVIAVKIGELPKKMDPSLKIYLDSTTYLTWGESRFWNKLFFILPSRSSSDNTSLLRFVGDHF